MALQLNSYTNNLGIQVGYWKISQYSLRTLYKSVDITISGWKDKASCDNNDTAIEYKKVRCLADKFDYYFSTETLDKETNPLQQIYKFAKENSGFFADAEDV